MSAPVLLGLFNDNLTVSITSTPLAGDSYTHYNLTDSRFIANKNMNIGNDGFTYINAKNSAVEVDSTITATGKNAIGAYLDDDTIGGTVFSGPYALGNSGNIILSGDSSTGIYGKNISTAIGNAGTITVGDKSTAAYSEDSTLENISGGNINIGSESTGMYLVSSSGKTITNNGTITGLAGKNKSVGMIVENTSTTLGITPTLINSSTIDIKGTEGVGIYSRGVNNSNVVNNGTITLATGISETLPNIGIYSDNKGRVNNNTGTISTGDYGIGIYAEEVRNGGNISVQNSSIGIFSSGSGFVNSLGSISVGTGESVGIFATGSGKLISMGPLSSMTIGDTSFGIVNTGSGNGIVSDMLNVNLSNDSMYIYSIDTMAPTSVGGSGKNIVNYTAINMLGSRNYGIYSAGIVENNGNIKMDAFNTIGNVGIFSINGGEATNNATITVGYTEIPLSANIKGSYGIGMAAGFNGDATTSAFTGNITNNGIIDVNGANSIGMYGSGVGTTVTNNDTINLNADGAVGMYLDRGAKGYNYGTITSIGRKGAIGVVLKNGATLNNQGTITIDSVGGYALFNDGGVIENYGIITIASGALREYAPTSDPSISPVRGGVQVDGDAGVITVNGVSKPITPVSHLSGGVISSLPVFTGALPTISTLSIGMYVNTSGVQFTNPIGGISNLLGLTKAKLIFGSEVAKRTTSKYVSIDGNDPILKPYNAQIVSNPQITEWEHISGSITWEARADVDRGTGEIKTLYMAKIPYTTYSGDKDTYNFTDGLEQRYGIEGLDTKENELFQKLNGIGNNEEILLYQAIDEMMGHQYANTQQRINSTGNILDKEFNYLRKEWETSSKDSNKVKVFGSREEYNTDTAGVIDYTSNSYGVAYSSENETIKLGNSSGWYAGYVQNRFKFKDIGKSKETQNMIKAGIYNTKSFDDNGSLQWTISGEGFVGQNDMTRRFLVVDEIFKAKGNYYTYGAGLKNEISKILCFI